MSFNYFQAMFVLHRAVPASLKNYRLQALKKLGSIFKANTRLEKVKVRK